MAVEKYSHRVVIARFSPGGLSWAPWNVAKQGASEMMSSTTAQSNSARGAQGHQKTGLFCQTSRTQEVTSFRRFAYRRNRSAPTPRAAIRTLLVLAVMIMVAATPASVDHASPSGLGSTDSSASTLLLANSVGELLEKIKKELEDAKNKVDPPESPTGRNNGAIPGLKQNLDAAEEHIIRLLDPLREPSLSPYDPAAYETIDVLITLEEHADAALLLATEALAICRTTDPPMQSEQISAKMNTLLHTILPGYRLAAGL